MVRHSKLKFDIKNQTSIAEMTVNTNSRDLEKKAVLPDSAIS